MKSNNNQRTIDFFAKKIFCFLYINRYTADFFTSGLYFSKNLFF